MGNADPWTHTMRRLLSLGLCLFALALPADRGHAQIQSFDLAAMLARTDHVVAGEIVEHEVLSFPDPSGEGVNWFTRLTIDGRSLIDGRELSVDVHFLGGMTESGEGVWNSEAPLAEDVEQGGRVVAFYKWLDDMGGGVPGNFLYAMHGGLFRTVSGPQGPVVLGRGQGYAVRENLLLDDLDEAVRTLSR